MRGGGKASGTERPRQGDIRLGEKAHARGKSGGRSKNL